MGQPSKEQIELLQKSVDSIYEMLRSVIAVTGERVTDGEKSVPDGFVPALPSDPYEILAYFGFPADSVKNVSYLCFSYSVFVFNKLHSSMHFGNSKYSKPYYSNK